MTASDNDMIRRGDALAEIELYRGEWSCSRDAIAALPAAQPSPDVAALVEAAAKIGQIVGFLGEDEARIDAFREACGPKLWAEARAALARKQRNRK